MAENRNIHVQLQVSAETKQAKAQFQDLISSLQKISLSSLKIDDSSIKKASADALELQRHLEAAFNVNTGKLDLNQFSASLNTSGKTLQQYYASLQSVGTEGQQAFLKVASAISQAEAPLLTANAKVQEFLGTLKNTARWQISSSILHGFMGAIQQAYGFAQDLNESLNNIQIVTGHNADYMADFAAEANKAAQALNSTTLAYTDAALIYYQQGLSDDQVQKRTEVTLKMANVSRQSAEEVSQQMTSVWNNFDDGSKSMEYYADVMTKLGAETATSSSEIAQGLQKFSSIGKTVGLSYEYAASALATITATTRESADTVGNALKTLFARIQGLKLGETLEDGVDLNKYSKALQAVGVEVLNANGELRDMDAILDDLGARWDTIGREQQVALAQTVAGQRQYAQFMTLMSNWDFMKENIERANNATGTLQEQADIYAKSWEAASKNVRTALEQIYMELADDNFFISLSKGIEGALQSVHGLIEGLGGLKGILSMVASIALNSLSAKLPSMIQNAANSFQILSGKARESAIAMQGINQAAVKVGLNEEITAVTQITSSLEAERAKIAAVSEAKQQLMENESKLSDKEKAEAQALLDRVSYTYDLIIEEAKKLDGLNQELNTLSDEIRNSFVEKGADASYVDQLLLEYRACCQELAAIEVLQNSVGSKVDEWKQKISLAEQEYQEGKISLEQFEEVQSQVTQEAQNFIKILDGRIDLSKLTEGWDNAEIKAKELFEIIEKIVLSDKSIIFKTDANEAGASVEGLRKSAESTRQALLVEGAEVENVEDKIDQYAKKSEEAGKKSEKLSLGARQAGDAVSNIAKRTPTLLQSLTSIASAAMSLNMVLSSIKRFSEVFTDKDATTIEKISAVIGVLTSVIFAFSSISSAAGTTTLFLTGTVTAETAAFWGLAAGATGAQVAIAALTKAAPWLVLGAVVLAAATHFSKLKKEAKEANEEISQRSHETADKIKTEREELGKTIEEHDTLIKNYKDALKTYQDTGKGYDALVSAAEALDSAYETQAGHIAILTGHYEDLLAAINKESQAERDAYEEKIKKEQNSLKSGIAANYRNEKENYLQSTDSYDLSVGVFGHVKADSDYAREISTQVSDYYRIINDAIGTGSESLHQTLIDASSAAQKNSDDFQGKMNDSISGIKDVISNMDESLLNTVASSSFIGQQLIESLNNSFEGIEIDPEATVGQLFDQYLDLVQEQSDKAVDAQQKIIAQGNLSSLYNDFFNTEKLERAWDTIESEIREKIVGGNGEKEKTLTFTIQPKYKKEDKEYLDDFAAAIQKVGDARVQFSENTGQLKIFDIDASKSDFDQAIELYNIISEIQEEIESNAGEDVSYMDTNLWQELTEYTGLFSDDMARIADLQKEIDELDLGWALEDSLAEIGHEIETIEDYNNLIDKVKSKLKDSGATESQIDTVLDYIGEKYPQFANLIEDNNQHIQDSINETWDEKRIQNFYDRLAEKDPEALQFFAQLDFDKLANERAAEEELARIQEIANENEIRIKISDQLEGIDKLKESLKETMSFDDLKAAVADSGLNLEDIPIEKQNEFYLASYEKRVQMLEQYEAQLTEIQKQNAQERLSNAQEEADKYSRWTQGQQALAEMHGKKIAEIDKEVSEKMLAIGKTDDPYAYTKVLEEVAEKYGVTYEEVKQAYETASAAAENYAEIAINSQQEAADATQELTEQQIEEYLNLKATIQSFAETQFNPGDILSTDQIEGLKSLIGESLLSDFTLDLGNGNVTVINAEQLSEEIHNALIGASAFGAIDIPLQSLVTSMDDIDEAFARTKDSVEATNNVLEVEPALLSKVASQYENCNDELEDYLENLEKGTEEQKKASKSELELAVRSNEAAKKFGVEQKQVQSLAKSYIQMSKTMPDVNDQMEMTEELATSLATRYIRMNKGIADIQKNYESYTDVLHQLGEAYNGTSFNADSLNSILFDNADAVEGLQTSVANMLNFADPTQLSLEFIAEHMADVEAAANGDSEAIERLQLALAEDFQAELGLDDSEFQAKAAECGVQAENLADWISNLPEGELTLENAQFLESLGQAMFEAGMAADEIEKQFAEMGIVADFDNIYEGLQGVVDASGEAANLMAQNVTEGADNAAEGGGLDAAVVTEQYTDTDTKEAVDMVGHPEPVEVSGSIPLIQFGTFPPFGMFPVSAGSLPTTAVYPGVTYDTDKTEDQSDNEQTAAGVELKSAHKTGGGGVSKKNLGGGNKGGGGGRGRRGGGGRRGRSSAPRTGTITKPHIDQPDLGVLKDFLKKDATRDVVQRKHVGEDEYTTRKKYYNERYERDKVYRNEDYLVKDASNFLRLSDEIDRYHNINKELEKIQSNLDAISERKSRAFGKAHLDAIDEETNALKQQLEAQKTLYSQQKTRQQELAQSLNKEGAEFDEDGNLINYNEMQENKVDKYNEEQSNIIDMRNKGIAAENKAKQKATDKYNAQSKKITDFKNNQMNAITDEYNARVENADNIRNAEREENTNYYNNRLKDITEQNYYEEQMAIEQYNNEITSRKAVRDNQLIDAYNKYQADLDKIWNTAISKSKKAESKSKDKKDSGKKAKISSAEAGTEVEVLEKYQKWFNQEKEKLKYKYDDLVKEINNNFEEEQANLDFEYERNQDQREYEYETAKEDLDFEYEELETESKQRYEELKRNIDNEYEDRKNIIDNTIADMEDERDIAYDEAFYAADEAREKNDQLADLRAEQNEQWREDLEKNIEEQENLETSTRELGNTIRQTMNQIYDSMLEKAQYNIEIRVQISDEVLKTLEAYLDNLGTSAEYFGDRLGYMAKQMDQYNYQLKTYRDGLKNIINSTGEIDNATMNRIMNGSWTKEDLDTIFNTDEFTADKIGMIENARDQLMSLLQQQRALREEMYSNLNDAFTEYNTNLTNTVNKIQTLSQVTQTYQGIIGIVGKKVLDFSGQVSKALTRAAFDQQRAQTHAYKSQLDYLDSSIADLQQQQAKMKALNDAAYEEEIKSFQKQIDEMQAERDSTYGSWLDSWQAEVQAAQDYFIDALDTIVMHFETSIAGAMGSLDALAEEYDRQKQIADVYVEDYEKIYQLTKLQRDVQNSIDDSDQVRNKQQLKKLQQEINKASEDGNKLSQYDLDVLRKKYELELARDQLQEARDAKSQVRMMRDSEGNYGYVYTADANAVADAEQNYEDKLHEMQVLNTDYIKSLQEQIIQTDQECRDAIAALNIADFASMEEYLDAVNRIEDDYTKLRAEYEQQIGNAIGNNRELYTGAWKSYSEMTGYKISADELYLDKFTETQYSVLTGFSSMAAAQDSFVTGLSTAVKEAIESYKESMDMTNTALTDGDTNIQNFADDTLEAITGDGGVVDQTNAAAEAAEKLSREYQNSFRTIAEEAENFASKYVEEVQKTINKNLELIDTIAKIIESQANLDGQFGDGTGSGGRTSGTGSTDSKWDISIDEGEKIGAKSHIGNYLPYIGALLQYGDFESNYEGWGSTAAERESKLEEVFGKGAMQDVQTWLNEHAASDAGSYWLGMQNKIPKYSYDALKNKLAGSFDTGGYTGNWNSLEGRLAMLHEKELVLNQQDTSNILSAVGMIRQIAQTIDMNAFSASQFMGGMFSSGNGLFDNRQQIEQTVHITAEFPNATDHTEIIDAFDGLINLAAQYAGQKV